MSHDTHAHDAAGHGSLRDYVTGFLLSVVLTAIPFWLVMARPLSDTATAVLILALAAVQMIVHVIYFLHLKSETEEGWSIMALIFTIIVVVIVLSGSLWVMYHLNTNMMPMPHDMRQIP